ncbi:MAG: calcium-binding protein, partial [Tepidisphaeraceae bacterium]
MSSNSCIERLEARQLLYSAVMRGEDLLITGNENAGDVVFVSLSPDGKEIGVQINSAAPKLFPKTDIERIRFRGLSGNDTFKVSEKRGPLGIRVWMSGGDGHDTLIGGRETDYISGGKGNDIINAGDGRNTVYGGDGNDLIDSGAGNDYLSGGKGDDLLNAFHGRNTLLGNDGNDLLYA